MSDEGRVEEKTRSYKRLLVWQKALQVAEAVYLLTRTYPKSELYGLVSQMRRAAVSIVANIAEGYSRQTSKEYRQFLYAAYASAAELESLMLLSEKLNFTSESDASPIILSIDEIQRMLRAIIKKLN